jgi:lysozyme
MSIESEEINVKAFLKLIRFAEHGRDDPAVYNTLYGGSTFTGYTAHPNKRMKRWGFESTAAGAYQILYRTWLEAKTQGVVSDFSPANQDKLARRKLETRRALPYIRTGNIEAAIPLLRKEWTSLPGAEQSKMPMEKARHLFDGFVQEYTGK